MHFGRRTEFSRWGNCCNNARRDKHNNILKSSFNRATLREKKEEHDSKSAKMTVWSSISSRLQFWSQMLLQLRPPPLLFHFLSARVAVQMQGHGNHCTAQPPVSSLLHSPSRLLHILLLPPHIFLFELFNSRFYSRANNVSRIHSLIAQLIIIINFSFTDLLLIWPVSIFFLIYIFFIFSDFLFFFWLPSLPLCSLLAEAVVPEEPTLQWKATQTGRPIRNSICASFLSIKNQYKWQNLILSHKKREINYTTSVSLLLLPWYAAKSRFLFSCLRPRIRLCWTEKGNCGVQIYAEWTSEVQRHTVLDLPLHLLSWSGKLISAQSVDHDLC